MDAAHTIRQSLASVATLREQVNDSKPLQNALTAIKQFQAQRFAGTYQDLLQSSAFCAPTRFFLEELYGVQDFSARDEQFGRIAGALQNFFPSQVVATAVALAQLHAQTECLDLEMARHCQQTGRVGESDGISCARYVHSWRAVSTPAIRMGQLQSVLNIGQELHRLTGTRGLGITLRLMRGPAKAAGLHSLQSFLEEGFDTFASLGKMGNAQQFLEAIRARESSWIQNLFSMALSDCEAELAACLEKAV